MDGVISGRNQGFILHECNDNIITNILKLKELFDFAGYSQLIDYLQGVITSCPKQGNFILIRTK